MRSNEIRILERRFNELTKVISDVEHAMQHADPKLRKTYSARLTSILQRRRTVQDRLAELRLKKALAWEESDVATGLERVIDRLSQGLERLTARRRAH
jgi:hypothetical protein